MAKYLIWSVEHDAWWKPNERGYAKNISEAGEYDYERACEIVKQANVVSFNECMIPIACLNVAHV